MTTGALAARFGTSPANASLTVRRLAEQGLVDHVPYKHVTLTARGERLALAMVRRHRLLETFLVRTLGYSWDEVHDEAERLEHAVSEVLIDRIDAALDHPRTDPHGDAIPTADGALPPLDAIALGEVGAPGTYEVSRVDDDDPALLAAAQGLGLVPGGRVAVEVDPALAVRGADGVVREIGADVAAAVRVHAVGDEASGPGDGPA